MYKTKLRMMRMMILIFCMMTLAGCRKREEEIVVLEEVELEESKQAESGETVSETEEPEQKDTIFVHVCGQVAAPGVYEIEAGSRIYEALRMAGGMTEAAAADYVNQAQLLTDGQKIYIPSMQEMKEGIREDLADSAAITENETKININTADKAELMTLTGIGEVRAEAILAYRREQGGFKTVEELMQVEGIKQGTYDKIKDRIRVP